MQDYVMVRIDATPAGEDVSDLLAAFLGDIGYESFVPDEKGLSAYVRDDLFSKESLKEVLDDFPMEVNLQFSHELVKGENWNSEWEKNYFKPIVVDDRCVVHSTFHKDVPEAEYDIVIDPKMAFGTGHHSTTSQMMRHILETDMNGKSVIDMGTGTGILSILSSMRGAVNVVGIEIDPYACENAVENVGLNHVNARMICGDASTLEGLEPADIFLANINRNVITGDIAKYAKALKSGGEMFLSGFYSEDIPIVEEAAAKYNLKHISTLEDNNWVAIKLVKTV